MVVSVGHWWVFQYFRVPFSFVIVQFRTVFCPSVENILVFCEALFWYYDVEKDPHRKWDSNPGLSLSRWTP